MHIVVCVKQVPVSNNLKIDEKTKNVLRTDEIGVINPFDKNALEAALKLKETHNAKVTVLSMGPSNFEITLRKGLAMGADEAILLSSRSFAGADTLATGYVLSKAIEKLGDVDLIFFGRQSIDADTGQVGPIVAEFLNLPQATYVHEISDIDENKMIAKRLMENMEQTIELTLPAALTVRSELNDPRYETPRNIKISFLKDIKVWNEIDLNCDLNRIGIKGSPTIVREVWSPELKEKEMKLLGNNPKEAARKFVEILRDRNIL